MITIQENLNVQNPEEYLDRMATAHWDSLNKLLVNKKCYYKSSIITKCQATQSKTGTKDYLENYADNDSNTAKRHNEFFNFLTRNKAEKLREIITARPNEFNSIKDELLKIIRVDDIYTGTPGNYKQTAFGKLLTDNIFNYNSFRAFVECKKMLTTLGFDRATCPYCNDNKLTIINISKGTSFAEKKKAYLDIDHFYPKILYPFFAISFFNLIPTCHDCNSSEKGDKPFSIETHINPYVEAFEDLFRFEFSLCALLSNSLDKITIASKGSKSRMAIDDLSIEQRYQSNVEEARILIDLFWKNKKNIGTNFESDFVELLLRDVPKERKDILKYQRGKMKRDILLNLDIDNILEIKQ